MVMVDALESSKIRILPLWTEVGGRGRPKVIGWIVSKCPKMMGKQWSETVKPREGAPLRVTQWMW